MCWNSGTATGPTTSSSSYTRWKLISSYPTLPSLTASNWRLGSGFESLTWYCYSIWKRCSRLEARREPRPALKLSMQDQNQDSGHVSSRSIQQLRGGLYWCRLRTYYHPTHLVWAVVAVGHGIKAGHESCGARLVSAEARTPSSDSWCPPQTQLKMGGLPRSNGRMWGVEHGINRTTDRFCS